jgi:single-strand DNA-binding protein
MLAVELIGNLGGDALVKDFGDQKCIYFSVAHNGSYTDAQSERHEKTVWVNCRKYFTKEDKLSPYLKKGTRVFVRGELSTKIYDSRGTLQVALDCLVKELQLLGGNKTEQSEQSQVKPDPESPAPAEDMNRNDDLPF